MTSILMLLFGNCNSFITHFCLNTWFLTLS
uniref:Uncharacterized protein n=1 Tax=Anguilla anguilla TaxID=7936 RepID=A0A0E9SPD2_ANGAN